MYRRLNHWSTSYYVVSRADATRDLEYVPSDDPRRVESFLRELWNDVFNRQSLRAVAYEHFGPVMAMAHDDMAVIQRLAHAFAGGSLRLATGVPGTRRATYGVGVGRESNKPENRPEPETRRHSFSVLVVEDTTSEPIPRVRIHVTPANGTRYPLGTNSGGVAEILDVPAGSHLLSSPRSGATVATTLAFVGRGETPIGQSSDKPGGTAKARSGTSFWIAEVIEHRVKTGETFQEIAKQHGLSVGELAYFNWAVYSEQEIQTRLRDEVGCTRRSKDGRFVFDDADDPGIIYIPREWSEPGLLHDQRHTIRARRIERRRPDLKLLYQIDTESPEAKNDTLTLETEDGAWRHTIQVSSLEEIEPDWVELVFPQPPMNARFNLVQDPGDGHPPFYVFKGLTWGELRAAHADQIQVEQEVEQQEQSDAA